MNEFYSEYQGTKILEPNKISTIFKNKKITINKNDDLYKGKNHQYLAQEKIKINTYEKEVVELLWNFLENKDIKPSWLVRNERYFQIYSMIDGRAFEPDFVLIIQGKFFYQIFIEPKNEKLSIAEKWKEDLMKDLEKYSMEKNNYRIIALPFYNPSNKDYFNKKLESISRNILLFDKS